jgi:hypothetical protein
MDTLPLTKGYAGKHVQAAIQSKYDISNPGPEVLTAIVPIRSEDVTAGSISPDFRNFVESENTKYVDGLWTVLGLWTSSVGDNLVNGYGLREASAGATLLYQNDAPTSDMTIKLVMTSEKEGQGFALPGSGDDGMRNGNADIFIKYDPRTKNGYSLRLWRTTQSATKCMYQFYQHVNGVGSPISSKQVLSGVLKPNTHMTISAVGSTLRVTAFNDRDAEKLDMEEHVAPNQFGGAGVRWPGSTTLGSGNVFSLIEITYP